MIETILFSVCYTALIALVSYYYYYRGQADGIVEITNVFLEHEREATIRLHKKLRSKHGKQ